MESDSDQFDTDSMTELEVGVSRDGGENEGNRRSTDGDGNEYGGWDGNRGGRMIIDLICVSIVDSGSTPVRWARLLTDNNDNNNNRRRRGRFVYPSIPPLGRSCLSVVCSCSRPHVPSICCPFDLLSLRFAVPPICSYPFNFDCISSPVMEYSIAHSA